MILRSLIAVACPLLLCPSMASAVSQVEYLVTYQGSLVDSFNPAAGELQRFTVALQNVSNSRNITAFRLNIAGTGLYQVQSDNADSVGATLFSDDLPEGNDRLADTHLLLDHGDVIFMEQNPPQEGLLSPPAKPDGKFRGFTYSLASGDMGLRAWAQGSVVPVAQVVLAPGGEFTLWGLSAVAIDTDPGTINPPSESVTMVAVTIPERPAPCGLPG